jgi:DNA-binding HxlR family transcriptional regulator
MRKIRKNAMKTENLEERVCPIEENVKIFGGKWKASILFHLSEGQCRFNELRRRIPAITQRMLTQQLRELERDGLVIREQFNEIPPRVEYSLSKVGLSLEPIFLAIEQWGKLHSEGIEAARARYDLRPNN